MGAMTLTGGSQSNWKGEEKKKTLSQCQFVYCKSHSGLSQDQTWVSIVDMMVTKSKRYSMHHTTTHTHAHPPPLSQIF